VAFQGNAAQIPLSNILQALTLNGQVGVLTVENPSFRRRIRLHKLGLRPLNFVAMPPDLLEMVLLKQNLLSEAQCQNIFSTWKPESSYPGDLLVRRRILTPENVEGEFRTQVENALLDVFIAPNLQYEFQAGEEGIEYELFDPDGLGELMLFNINSILMEAARREDEWSRFRAEISNDEEIFRIRDRVSLSVKKLSIPPHNLREMKPHLHGESTISRICEETTLSHFEILEALYHLKKADLIRPLALAEKKALAEKLRHGMRHKDAASIYESVLLNDPDDIETREHLVRLYGSSRGSEAPLAHHYTALATSLSEVDSDRALSYLGKALETDPMNVEALESYFVQSCTSGRSRDAYAALRRARAMSDSSHDAKSLRDLLLSLSNSFPEEVLLLHELAESYGREKDTENAVDCLKKAAEIYESRNDVSRLAKCAEKIARLRPSEAPKARKIVEAQRKSKKPFLRLARVAVTASLLCGSLSLLVTMGVLEWFSRGAFADVRSKVDTLNSYGQFDKSRQLISEFEDSYPLSLKRLEAETLNRRTIELETAAEEFAIVQLESRRSTAESQLVRAQIEASRDRYSEALEIIDSVDAEVLPIDRAEKRLRLRTELLSYFQEAEDLRKRAQAARQNQDVAKSHALTKQLITRFPRAPVALSARLPVRIETSPPGAQLQVNGKAVGETPAIFDFLPNALSSILLVRQGYVSVNLNRTPVDGQIFNPLNSAQISVELEKALEWRFTTDASVECVPSTVGKRVFVANRNGTIYCLDPSNGSQVWGYATPNKMDVAGGLGVWNNVVYFGCFDGRVYAVKESTGEPLYPGALASKSGVPIKDAASQASAQGIVALNCSGKFVSGFDLSTGRVLWSRPFTKTRVLGRPFGLGNSTYVVTSAGNVLEIDLTDGEIQRHATLQITPHYQVASEAGQLFIASRDGEVLSFNTSDWRSQWRYKANSMLSGPPTVDSSFVIVPTGSGHLVCLTTDGKLKWRQESPFSVAAQGVLFRNTFLVGTMTGQVLSIDTWNGKLRWTFATETLRDHEPKAFLSAGIVSQGKLFIGSEDHSLYCFTVE
jgi:outer membrane protein assembly factor BamB